MSTHRLVASLILAGLASIPAAALAQTAGKPALLASAFSNKNGPTVTFRENPAQSDAAPPRIRRMDVGRPARVSVATPPSRRTLGTLSYEIGERTQPASEIKRKVSLRRRATLSGGRYELANFRGARVVLATRSRTGFLTITLPTRARYVTLSLRGRGARLLNVRGSCTSQRFTARFVTVPSNKVVRDSSMISSRALRSAGLC